MRFLSIYFINPLSKTETRWILHPFTHNKVAEKESLITKMESGSFTPSLKLAKKLEKFLIYLIVSILLSSSVVYGSSSTIKYFVPI